MGAIFIAIGVGLCHNGEDDFNEGSAWRMKKSLSLILALLVLLGMLPACAPQVPAQSQPSEQETTYPVTTPVETMADVVKAECTAYGVSVNEVMPDNRNLLLGHELDWVELYNPGDIPVSLEGYYLTNDLQKPEAMSLEGYTIRAGGYLAVTLDGPLQLSEQGQTVYLTCNGEVISQLTFGMPW